MMQNELSGFVIGEKIGSGIHNDVYTYCLDNKYVIKVAKGSDGRFMNLLAAKIWFDVVEHKAVAKWLAPIEAVSGHGKYLIQRRTKPVKQVLLPKNIPSFFTDLKIQNFGSLGNTVVCHDYGCINLTGQLTRRMQNASWWDGEAVG